MSTRDVTVKWDDPNMIEKGHKVYRSKTPMDINNMPEPIATLDKNTTEFIDVDQTIGDTNYYRVSAWIDGTEQISQESSVYIDIIQGQALYTSGDYEFVVPPNVFVLSIAGVGSGGKGGDGGYSTSSNRGCSGGGGGGGATAYVNDIDVKPDDIINVSIGNDGTIVKKDGTILLHAGNGYNGGYGVSYVRGGSGGSGGNVYVGSGVGGNTGTSGQCSVYNSSTGLSYPYGGYGGRAGDVGNGYGNIDSITSYGRGGRGGRASKSGPMSPGYDGVTGAVRFMWGEDRLFPSTNIDSI